MELVNDESLAGVGSDDHGAGSASWADDLYRWMMLHFWRCPTFVSMLCCHCCESFSNFEEGGSHIYIALSPANYVASPAMEEKELGTVIMDNSFKKFYVNEVRKMKSEEEGESRESF